MASLICWMNEGARSGKLRPFSELSEKQAACQCWPLGPGFLNCHTGDIGARSVIVGGGGGPGELACALQDVQQTERLLSRRYQ